MNFFAQHRTLLTSLVLFLAVIALVVSPLTIAAPDGGIAINITEANEQTSGALDSLSFMGLLGDVVNFGWNSLFSVFVGMMTGILTLVGYGFDYVIDYTITDFAANYNANFADGINIAWAGFRDVANIVMIAMFVFVAFMVILNSQTYGLKQFGVRILIVAVLINFSLFFTKAVIDVSNVTAQQFQKAIVITNAEGGGTSDISAAIMEKTGLAGWFYFGAFETLNNLSLGKDGEFGDALMYTILAVTFSGAMIVVFLYGLILLTTRAVVFLVLMVTSSLAFTAYMIPKGQQWWDKWWETLVRNALFAPFFMMMLWAVMNVLQSLGGTSKAGGSIENMVKEDGWSSIFNMMIVVGLVYASIKISSELSTLGGNFARKMSAKGLGLALRASGIGQMFGLAGRGGRALIGGGARAIENSTRLQKAASNGGLVSRFASRGALAAAEKVAKTSFDFRDSSIDKQLSKLAGVKGPLLGKGVGSRMDVEKEDAQYLERGANAAAEELRKAARDSAANEKAQSTESKGGAEDSGAPSAQTIATDRSVAQAGADSSAAQQSQEKAGVPSKEKQNELTGNAAEIQRQADAIRAKQEEDGGAWPPGFGQTYEADNIPTSEGERSVKNPDYLGTIDAPDVVDAVNRVGEKIEPSTSTSEVSPEASLEKQAQAARDKFIADYQESRGGIRDFMTARGTQGYRDRIADVVKKNTKQTKDDKKVKDLEERVKKLGGRVDDLGDKDA